MKNFLSLAQQTNETKTKAMKQVININFQGCVVPIEVKAYDLLEELYR